MSQLIDEQTARQFDRLPPSDIEAEQGLLGSCMLDRDMFFECRQIVNKNDFYQADHEIIWDVMCAVADSGSPIDALLLHAALTRRQLLEEIGGAAYIGQILHTVPSWAHGAHYAKRVREVSMLRRIISVCNDGLRGVYARSEEDGAVGLSAKLATELAQLCSFGGRREPATLEEAVHSVLERRDDPKPRRIPTGLNSLDSIIGGVARGHFLILGAKGGMGKSQTAKQIVRNIARTGIKCGIVTVEEDREKIAENYLSNASKVENNKIAFGKLNSAEWDKLYQSANELAELPIIIDDASFSLSEITASIQRLVAKHKVEVVVVDHIHLVDGEHDGNREREIAKISAGLKILFRKLNIAGIGVAQFNRAGGHGELPSMKNLRDSGALEQDGDTIILLHREDYYRWKDNPTGFVADHILQAIVDKNKNGMVGIAKLHFDGATQTVRDLNQIEAMEAEMENCPV